jgi:tetratricopeptide (TPR) repeat protein
MNPKFERIIVTITLVLVLLASYFIYHTISYRNSQMATAKNLITQFKIAKALDILNEIKTKGAKNEELDSLILYALIKAKKYEDAKVHIQNLQSIPKSFSKKGLEIISHLSIHDHVELLSSTITRSLALELDENFFINISQERNSLSTEMQILEDGLAYIRRRQELKENKNREIPSLNIERFILERCIDNANVYMGTGDFKSALFYLNKAKNLGVVTTDSLKDDYYYNLSLVHKALGNKEEAWDNMQISAKLGNERAKDILRTLTAPSED